MAKGSSNRFGKVFTDQLRSKTREGGEVTATDGTQ